MAYCRAHTPPGEDFTTLDLIQTGKFYLCKTLGYLWEDPIWDKYTDEEILVEYFAHLFSKDETFRKDFEVQIDAGTQVYGNDIFDWLDKMVEENQAEMKQKLEEMPDKISFSPDKDVEE
jgi:hypothetical protein